MPGSTIIQDRIFFDNTLGQFSKKSPKSTNGALNFSGIYWPDRVKNPIIYKDVEYAFNESRKIIAKAYLKASAGVRNDSAAAVYMKRWFGPRNAGNGVNDRDWWKGAKVIIGTIDDFINININVYYRGEGILKFGENKYSDYPGEPTRILTEEDIKGFAESDTGVQDNIIGLCKLFFKKDNRKASKMNLMGKDSVGGTLLHELSHNICKTDDHYTYDNSSDSCYGVSNCIELAEHIPSRAFYNADNIQYFCEDVFYGITGIASKQPISTSASRSVSSIGSQLGAKLPFGFPITYQDWMTKTALKGHWRSGDLKAVDSALSEYCNNGNPGNFSKLKQAFNGWYDRNPNERTRRNTDNCIGKLRGYLQTR